MPLRTPPHDARAEASVLGCCLLDNSIITHVQTRLTMADFYNDKNQAIYGTILVLHEEHRPVDLVTLTGTIEAAGKLSDIGGASAIANLINAPATSANWETYVGIVKDRSTARTLIESARRIAMDAYDTAIPIEETASKALQSMHTVARSTVPVGKRVHHISHSIGQVFAEVEEVSKIGGIPGIPTGFRKIDEASGGMHAGELWILIAPPGHGKSAMLGQFAEQAARRGPSLVCSNEMRAISYTSRTLSRVANVSAMSMRLGRVDDSDWTKLSHAAGEVAKWPLYIADDCFDLTNVLSAAQTVRDQTGQLQWISVDWLQLLHKNIQGRSEGRTREVDQIIAELKQLAIEMNIPVVLVSQYAAEGLREGKSGLSYGRDSAMIVYAADFGLAIEPWNEKQYGVRPEPITESGSPAILKLNKARHGRLDFQPVWFDAEHIRFVSIEEYRLNPFQ